MGKVGQRTFPGPWGKGEWSLSPFLIFLNQIQIVRNIQGEHKGRMIQLNVAERGFSPHSVVYMGSVPVLGRNGDWKKVWVLEESSD